MVKYLITIQDTYNSIKTKTNFHINIFIYLFLVVNKAALSIELAAEFPADIGLDELGDASK